MLGLREAHAPGPTRVSIDGHHVLTGGADGVVSLFSAKPWPKSAALWSFCCHEGAVTDVVLADAIELALSCGRDGRILLHENISDAAKLVSRVICQVTGEVRCLQLDVERRRVYIAGDSLRCLDMARDRFQIHTIPLVVPFPIISLAVSPCGRFIAMGSASGELGVVSVPFISASALEAPPTSSSNNNNTTRTQFVFRAVLSPTAKKDDAVRYRMAWCRTKAGGLTLMVPTATEVQVYQLSDEEAPVAAAGGAPAASMAMRMRAVGGLHDRQLTDLHGALVYPVTMNRLACVMASRDAIFIGKVEAKNLVMSRHTSETYSSTASGVGAGAVAATVTDVQVNPANGDVVVGLADGRVSLLRRASLKAWRPSPPKSTTDTAGDDGEAEGGHHVEMSSSSDAALGEHSAAAQKKKTKKRAAVHQAHEAEAEDDGFINDDSSASESSVSESSASASDSDASSVDSSESDAASEDFGKVVVDLQRNGASVHDNDDDRPSRWRDGDDEAALAHAEREMERRRARSRFLDDEAEEGSAEDDEDVEGDDDVNNDGARKTSRNRSKWEEDDDDEVDHCESASVEGQAEGDEGEGERSGDFINGHGGARLATSSTSPLLSGHLSAVQDYSFQVGATPAGEEGSCYLAYNSVGYIHCSREATTVHFHDISYPAVRVSLRDTMLMGSLSPVGAGFIVVPADATDGQSSVDEAPRLTVLYHAFTPLGAQSEWRVSLLPGETVRCMAAGIRYLAVATSHYLRIFSLSGLELAVLSKCQRIVTMVGTSSRKLMSSFKADFDPLAVVTLTGTGELQAEVIDVGARATALPARTIPLTELPDGSTHQLQWLGWSEDGLLHTVDTAGVVRMLTESWGGSWVPVYDPRTLVDQSYALWVYGVSDNALLAYRYSRSDPSYPAAAASGLSTELVPLFLPLTRTMGEEGRERWDKVLRQQLRSDELKRHSTFYNATIAKYDEVHDHHLLHFFETALKDQQTTRALELAMLMEIHDRVVKCAQLANNSGYAKLVPKLLALYEMRMSMKSKRRCTLPLKETMVSDKKKDELLRKLLGQMLPQDKKEKAAAAAESPAVEGRGATAGTAVSVDDSEETTKKDSTEVTAMRPEESSRRAPSVTSTATTAATTESSTKTASAVPVASPSTARRHISFTHDVAPPSAHTFRPNTAAAPSLSQTSSSSSSSFASTAGPRKVTNPFAKPAAAITATPTAAPASGQTKPRTGSVTATAAATAITAAPAVPSHQTRLPTVATGIHASHASPAPAPSSTSSSSASASRQTPLLGASQLSTPPRTMVATASPSVPPTVFQQEAPPPSQQQQDGDDAATGLSSLGGTPEDRRASAGRIADSPAQPHNGSHDGNHTLASDGRLNAEKFSAPPATASLHSGGTPAKPSTGFIARALPTRAYVSSGPVDPFLAGDEALQTASMTSFRFLMGGASGSTQSDVPAVSLQSLLDVGHNDTAPVVRSSSFGEALRKRYRDDDEEDDEVEGVPLAAVPKLAL